jgi:hypothetical protein
MMATKAEIQIMHGTLDPIIVFLLFFGFDPNIGSPGRGCVQEVSRVHGNSCPHWVSIRKFVAHGSDAEDVAGGSGVFFYLAADVGDVAVDRAVRDSEVVPSPNSVQELIPRYDFSFSLDQEFQHMEL